MMLVILGSQSGRADDGGGKDERKRVDEFRLALLVRMVELEAMRAAQCTG